MLATSLLSSNASLATIALLIALARIQIVSIEKNFTHKDSISDFKEPEKEYIKRRVIDIAVNLEIEKGR